MGKTATAAKMAKKTTAAGKTAAHRATRVTPQTAAQHRDLQDAVQVEFMLEHPPAAVLRRAGGDPSAGSAVHALVRQGHAPECAITGTKRIDLCEAAAIFPQCWIDDGTYAERLAPFLPRDEITAELLNGPRNRIVMSALAHRLFDGRSEGAPRLGCWGLAPTCSKGVPLPATYTVVAKAEEREHLRDAGVCHGAAVHLPHAHPGLLAWHAARLVERAPTADSDLDDDATAG